MSINFRSWCMNCILSASTKSTQPFKTFVFLFFFPATGNKICNVIKNTLRKIPQMCPNQITVYSFRMEKLEKLRLLLISENASSPPGQKLVVGKNPILPLFDIANTAFASKQVSRIWRRNNSKSKPGGENSSARSPRYYRTTWTLCAKWSNDLQ